MFSICLGDNSEAVFISLNGACTAADFSQELVAQSNVRLAYAELAEVVYKMLNNFPIGSVDEIRHHHFL